MRVFSNTKVNKIRDPKQKLQPKLLACQMVPDDTRAMADIVRWQLLLLFVSLSLKFD